MTWNHLDDDCFSKLISCHCLQRPNVKLVLRRISCHGRKYSQPYFFIRNQSSDNRSHGFGAKFLLNKLSANEFSYERKSAFKRCNFPRNVSLMLEKELHCKLLRRHVTRCGPSATCYLFRTKNTTQAARKIAS